MHARQLGVYFPDAHFCTTLRLVHPHLLSHCNDFVYWSADEFHHAPRMAVDGEMGLQPGAGLSRSSDGSACEISESGRRCSDPSRLLVGRVTGATAPVWVSALGARPSAEGGKERQASGAVQPQQFEQETAVWVHHPRRTLRSVAAKFE